MRININCSPFQTQDSIVFIQVNGRCTQIDDFLIPRHKCNTLTKPSTRYSKKTCIRKRITNLNDLCPRQDKNNLPRQVNSKCFKYREIKILSRYSCAINFSLKMRCLVIFEKIKFLHQNLFQIDRLVVIYR